MALYRKKPVIIEAREWDGKDETAAEIVAWITARGHKATLQERREPRLAANGELCQLGRKHGIVIKTLEGDHLASPGDYVIEGFAGEFYPCKPDIFVATYDPVSLS
jgi:hypothetical protein